MAPIDAAQRARMRAVKRQHTGPEMIVRRVLHGLGLRFRLHRKDLAGTPDIVLPKHATVIFVHGCFWHRHGCKRATMPKTHADYWRDKFVRNVERDRMNQMALVKAGWRVLTVWECETRDRQRLEVRLREAFADRAIPVPT